MSQLDLSGAAGAVASGISGASAGAGRYALHDEIASGGMATVHLGRLTGAAGFSRTVAIKRLHPQYAKDPEFVSMFLDEARLASRIQHPNCVATIDVIAQDNELFLVMEYVQGESLSKLVRIASQRGSAIELGVVNAILSGALHGLHAAHEARDAKGEPLNIVHRDVSPQNILVGSDGVARVLDFGVAKAAARLQTTEEGKMKGKIAYMAPEQLRAQDVDRRADVFAAGIVHWEALTGRRLFAGGDVGMIMGRVLNGEIALPSSLNAEVSPELDAVVMRALERDANQRFRSAREYAIAVENAGPIALARHVGEWVERIGGDALSDRSSKVARIEKLTDTTSSEQVAQSRELLRTNPRAFTGSGGAPILLGSAPSPVAYDASLAQSAESTAADVPTVSAVPHASRPATARRRLATIAAALTFGGAALVWLFTRAPAPPPTPTAAAPPSAPAVQAPAPPPVTVQPDLPAAAPSASVAPVATTPKSKPAHLATPVRHVGCSPPWVVDSKGIRRVKPQCT